MNKEEIARLIAGGGCDFQPKDESNSKPKIFAVSGIPIRCLMSYFLRFVYSLRKVLRLPFFVMMRI